jgi:hypothetical protein
MSQALRIASGILVGPGMNSGFWNDIGASSEIYAATLGAASPLHNFFEKIFQNAENVLFSI